MGPLPSPQEVVSDKNLSKPNRFPKVVIIPIVLIIIFLVGGLIWWGIKDGNKDEINKNSKHQVKEKGVDNENIDPSAINNNRPPTTIKNIGVNIDYYDPETNKAGDFTFTKSKLVFDQIFMDYGFFIPASSASPDKKNPQPTFLLPMGTKVFSLIDGVVVGVPKLYSGDYSVMVATSEDSPWRFETEHVINPIVKEGDKVRAGQVVAEVSPHDSQNNNGLGLVEIGILKGGGQPQHVCPFQYLDPLIKEDIEKKITALYKAWGDYRGNPGIYNESAYVSPGCLTSDPIEG